MIAMFAHHCHTCARGWAATFKCPTCPYCGDAGNTTVVQEQA